MTYSSIILFNLKVGKNLSRRDVIVPEVFECNGLSCAEMDMDVHWWNSFRSNFSDDDSTQIRFITCH